MVIMQNARGLFSEEQDRIRHEVLAMAALVDENLGKALSALRNSDADLARKVKAADAAINDMQLKIEDKAAVLIATQQPVATDLRELVTIFKLTVNLERAGDHAVHLAKTVIKLSGKASFRAMEHLEKMAETGQEMIRAALAAFLARDAAAARQAAALDDIIDREHKRLIKAVLMLMKKRPELLKKALRIIQTSADLERMGDHITNICEAIVYMTESRHEELNE
jgi:phosphate transport system protein